MGGFFTNVQVRVGDRPPDQLRRAIINALQTWALANDFAQSDGTRKVDRTIIVGMADGLWIPVYDELAEFQYDGLLLDLCTILSASTDSAVIGILVHDSDILYIPLFEHGRLVDSYVSDPEYFGPVESTEKQAQAGHADRWAGVLADGVRVDRLRTIWDTQHIFAEDLLKQVAQAIGLPTKSCLVGFNSLGSECRDSEVLTKLSFSRTRPSSVDAAEMFMLLTALKEKNVEGPESSRHNRAIRIPHEAVQPHGRCDSSQSVLSDIHQFLGRGARGSSCRIDSEGSSTRL
jgi:hypothetical protein